MATTEGRPGSMVITWKMSKLEHVSKLLQQAKDALARYDEPELVGQIGAALRGVKDAYDRELERR